MPVNLSEIASNIELRPDGLWCARTSSGVSYPEDGNQNCFTIEDSSFWFRHRNASLVELLKRFPPEGTFFDIGGGNGYVAQAIQDAGWEVVLVEPGHAGAQNARKRGIRQVVQATLGDAHFLPATLPAVGLFDVIEHIEDDRKFLQEVHGFLKANGRIYITVPAFQTLWSHEDEEAGHWRRYTLRSLSDTLTASGFQIEFATYIFGFLPFGILLLRALPFRFGIAPKRTAEERMRIDHQVGGKLQTKALAYLMERELRRLASGRMSRIGGSCLVVARANSSERST